MKKHFSKFGLIAILFALVACSSNDSEPWIEPIFTTEGVYILNEGEWTKGDGSLTYYNPETKEVKGDIFFHQNNKKLGELPNKVLIYENKMFIVGFESNVLFVTDLEGKLLSNGIISFDEKEYKLPRNIVSLNGKVYVNFYSGHLAQIDATTLAIEKTIKIEPKSEEMTIASNKKLYIADTNYGDGNTVTVVDLVSFTIERAITVPQNPQGITSDLLGNVYVISVPAYPASELNRIKTEDNSVHLIGKDIASRMAVLGGKLLLAHITYEGITPHTKYSYYDIYANTYKNESFITIPATGSTGEGEESGAKATGIDHGAYLDKLYSITIDPIKNDIYITTSEYQTRGYVYIFSQTGKYKTSFNSEGINPNSVAFVTKETK